MSRTASLLAVFVLLVAGAAVPVAGSITDSAGSPAPAPQAETATAQSNGSAEAAAPGAQFAGVVAVQEAEVESELEGRVFGIQVARANSNSSKATVVAEQVEELDRRAEDLRERRESLQEARENGSISQARYRAEMAALSARTEALKHQLDRTQAASDGVPADLLESKGVNATAIETLRNDSRTLAGPEAAEIARSIAGPRSGDGLRGGNATPGLPGTVPTRNETPDDVLPGTDDFDTPTVPNATDVPGRGNGNGPPTDRGRPDAPTTDDGGVGDVLTSILGGSGDDGGTETPTDSDTTTDTTTTTETDGNDTTG